MNKNLLAIAIVLGVVLGAAIYTAPFSTNYESWSANQKKEWLWQQVVADKGESASPTS